ncbi:hypothetical protein PFISCL1PPCAC_14424, partial [Pristionchus fissidentatus]
CSQAFCPLFLQTKGLNSLLEKMTRDLYGLDASTHVVVYGSSIKHVAINSRHKIAQFRNDQPFLKYSFYNVLSQLNCGQIRRQFVSFGVTMSVRTLKMQRSFHIMQILQGFVPLAIISVPAIVFFIGAVAQTNLDFITLIFTFFLWACPAVQV